MERIKRRRLGAKTWQGILERFESSALTVEEFCRVETVSSKSFYRWRARLSAPPDGGMVPMAAAECNDPAVRFVDLGPLGARSAPSSRLEIKLDLGGGLMLHLVRG